MNIAMATEGGIKYEEALSMPVWQLMVVNDEIGCIQEKAKRKMKDK